MRITPANALNAAFYLAVISIAFYIWVHMLMGSINYMNTHCSFNELPKDLQS